MDWKEFFNDFADRYYSVPDFTNEEHVYALQNYLIEQGMLVEDVDYAIKTLLGEAPTDPRVRKQAKDLGLVSLGYGNWGKEKGGPTTHTNVDGKLTPVGDEKDDKKDKKDKKDDDRPINLSKGGKVDAQLGGDRDAGPTDMMDKDDVGKIKKDTDKKDEKPTYKEQSNGYVGPKNKELKQGNPSKTEEYQRDLEPDDLEFNARNSKDANPEPPPPLDLSEVIKNPKFPKRYLKVLERMANTKHSARTKKWSHFSDIEGGQGKIKAQAGELMTMIGCACSDEEFEQLLSALEEHERTLIDTHPKIFMKKNNKGKLIDNPGSRIIDKSWIKSARQNRTAILTRLKDQYGDGVEVVGGAWDVESEVEAMGMEDYKENKGFSTDMYLKVRKPNGEEVLDETSLKKSKLVNFLNSGAGIFDKWDENLPDNINQNKYRENARKRNIDFINENMSEVQKLINSKEGEGIKKLMKNKNISFEQALEGDSRDKQNVLWQTIKLLQKQGNKGADKIVKQDTKEHNQFVADSVKAITENEKMREGMLAEIRSEFPLKAVSDGEENMAIGHMSLDKKTMKNIFGTDNYDEVKENLEAQPGPPPFIGYRVEAGGEIIPVAQIGIREDGRGYGGQFKFEMILHPDFANRLDNAQSEIYGEK